MKTRRDQLVLKLLENVKLIIGKY